MKSAKGLHFLIVSSLLALLGAELVFMCLYFIIVSGVSALQSTLLVVFPGSVEVNYGIFNPITFLPYIFGVILVSVVAFVEVATIITIIAHNYFFSDSVRLSSVFYFIKNTYKKLGKQSLFLIFLFFFFFPKDHIGLPSQYNLEIPPFILDEILKNPLPIFGFFIGILFLSFLAYRGAFTMHILLFEDTKNILSAFKKSSEMVKTMDWKEKGKNFFTYVYFEIIFWTGGVLFLEVLHLLFSQIFEFFQISVPVLDVVFSYILSLFSVVFSGVLLLVMLTVVYIRQKNIPKKQVQEFFHFSDENPHSLFLQIQKIWEQIPKKIFWICMSFCLIFSLVFIFSQSKIYKFQMQNIDIIAHRGYLLQDGEEKFIENTIAAIENAHKNGANLVEIDVYQNAEGTLYLSHDENLKRVFGIDKNIFEMTDTALDDAKIVSLETVLRFAKKHNISLLVEIKISGHEKNIAKTFVDLVQKYQGENLVSLHSLDRQTAVEINRLYPALEVGYTVFGVVGNIATIEVDFFAIQETALSASLIQNIHKADKKAYIWTLNDEENLEKYVLRGVDGIITDQVEQLDAGVQELRNSYQLFPQYTLQIFTKKIFLPRWEEA